MEIKCLEEGIEEIIDCYINGSNVFMLQGIMFPDIHTLVVLCHLTLSLALSIGTSANATPAELAELPIISTSISVIFWDFPSSSKIWLVANSKQLYASHLHSKQEEKERNRLCQPELLLLEKQKFLYQL